jgi:hypothetical protein
VADAISPTAQLRVCTHSTANVRSQDIHCHLSLRGGSMFAMNKPYMPGFTRAEDQRKPYPQVDIIGEVAYHYPQLLQ